MKTTLKIAPWQEVVGDDFLTEFTKLEKAMFFAVQQEGTIGSVLDKAEKKHEGITGQWRAARKRMFKCGLEKIGQLWYVCGYAGMAVLSGDNVDFRFYARTYGRKDIDVQYVSYKEVREMITLLEVEAEMDGKVTAQDIERKAQKLIGTQAQKPTNGDLFEVADDEGGFIYEE